MVTVHIDLPIFSSPTEPFGWFSGDVEFAAVPTKDAPFPWPKKWLGDFPELFARQATQVWGDAVDWPYPPASAHVTMYGLVCRDRNEARRLSQHIERCSGIAFDEHAPQ
jgi:hypothetical protein